VLAGRYPGSGRLTGGAVGAAIGAVGTAIGTVGEAIGAVGADIGVNGTVDGAAETAGFCPPPKRLLLEYREASASAGNASDGPAGKR